MKNRYTSFFLIIFLLDGLLTILNSILNLLKIDVLNGMIFKILLGIFHNVVLPLAIAQVIIAFRRRLKWSAKIIGLYPLVILLTSIVIGVGYFITTKAPINDANFSTLMMYLYVYLLIVGTIQLIVGLWASKDLSSGHYINAVKTKT